MAKTNLSESMKKIQAIIAWFDEQDEVDVEKGLEKIREGAALIKESKARLKEIENEFAIVRKDLEDDGENA
jgi:exonuclease VII small subunit